MCPRANNAQPTEQADEPDGRQSLTIVCEKLATGLSLTQAADVLEVIGGIDAAVRQRAYELGGMLAATLTE